MRRKIILIVVLAILVSACTTVDLSKVKSIETIAANDTGKVISQVQNSSIVNTTQTIVSNVETDVNQGSNYDTPSIVTSRILNEVDTGSFGDIK